MPSRSNTPRRSKPGSKASAAAAPVERQAGYHIHARNAQSTATAEDYVEVIADLIAAAGEARVTEAARCLGVTHVTVVRTIARLQRAGLVIAKPYRPIELTPAGQELAARVKRRHEVVIDFLAALGVSPEAAKTDSEGIEHHVSGETLSAMERFVQRCRAASNAKGAGETPAP